MTEPLLVLETHFLPEELEVTSLFSFRLLPPVVVVVLLLLFLLLLLILLLILLFVAVF
ncbi:unnamed protein product [Schistocephalus solidus]|uniref:Uncharacterized protein n=1 Tax=Schistocephalus solidus TaxID=70667 RepID=A0A3P7DHT9_SCHSO|nr:unnamed protein product [Schistocephalus solidus]